MRWAESFAAFNADALAVEEVLEDHGADLRWHGC